jgi:hypothetical protein
MIAVNGAFAALVHPCPNVVMLGSRQRHNVEWQRHEWMQPIRFLKVLTLRVFADNMDSRPTTVLSMNDVRSGRYEDLVMIF